LPERAGEAGTERKLNLLIVASSLWIGGAETVMRHLAHAIDRRRFNVTVCYLKERGHVGDELAAAGIDIIGLPGAAPGKVDYLSFRKLLEVIRSRRIDVAHTHTAHGLVDATMCKLFAPGLKVVHTFHFGNYPHTRKRIIWMERVFSRLADKLFAVGEVQRAQILAVHRVPPRRISTIWNGVTAPAGAGEAGFRERVGAANRVLVGTIATFINQKGLPDLLDVAARLRDEGRNVQFVVVGEGRMRAELEAKRRALRLDDRVTFTGWVTNAADVALPVFDVFFQPSIWEAMSVVILEAMAAGKPIVATRVGETPHIIEDGKDGFLVEPRDVGGMSVALGRLIEDAELRRRMGEAARRKVEQRFTVEHMTRAYEQAYLAARQ
jgi:glycosyltransferase involved in cell wall biosynthesis